MGFGTWLETVLTVLLGCNYKYLFIYPSSLPTFKMTQPDFLCISCYLFIYTFEEFVIIFLPRLACFPDTQISPHFPGLLLSQLLPEDNDSTRGLPRARLEPPKPVKRKPRLLLWLLYSKTGRG